MEIWGRAPSGFQGQRPQSGGLRAKPPEADDTSCENMLFGDGFKNDIAIYAFMWRRYCCLTSFFSDCRYVP